MRPIALTLCLGLLLAGCAANQATLDNLNNLSVACARGARDACIQVPAAQAQADVEARGKTTALLLLPFVILEAVIVSKY